MSNEFKKDDNVIDVNMQKIQGKINKFVPPIIIVIVLIVIAFNSVYILQDSENGVVLRFGTVSSVVEEAGLHFKLPFVEEVRKVNVENIYNMEYGFRTETSGTEYSEPVYSDQADEATIIVDAANNNASIALMELIIQYKVSDPVKYLFRVDDPVGTLRLALEDVVRSSVQSFTLDEAKTQKELIDKAILPLIQKKMDDYESGIEIVLVGTQNVQFLPNVETAYQQKENANQYKNTKEEDAQRYYNTVIPQAKAEATQLVEKANAYRAETIAEANASVAEFNALYEEYLNNPNILKEKYYIESMRTFLLNNKIVVDATNDGDIYKFYNFDESEGVKEQITSENIN